MSFGRNFAQARVGENALSVPGPRFLFSPRQFSKRKGTLSRRARRSGARDEAWRVVRRITP